MVHGLWLGTEAQAQQRGGGKGSPLELSSVIEILSKGPVLIGLPHLEILCPVWKILPDWSRWTYESGSRVESTGRIAWTSSSDPQ